MSRFSILSIILLVTSSFLLTVIIEKVCRRYAIFDIPGHRKIHTQPVPRVGGLSFLLIPLLAAYFFSIELPWTFVAGGLIIFAGGFYDDLSSKNSVLGKALVQLAGTLVFTWGLDLSHLSITLPTVFVLKIVISGFVFFVINSANLMDNMNGLTAGLAMIILTTMAYLASLSAMTEALAPALILVVLSVFGFYLRNFPFGKIYMGDQGSQLLGYLIATSPILVLPQLFEMNPVAKIVTSSFCIGLIVLPFLYDSFSVIYIRRKEGRPITQGDQSHISHRLHKRGFTQVQSVLIIKAFQLICIIFALSFMSRTHVNSEVNENAHRSQRLLPWGK